MKVYFIDTFTVTPGSGNPTVVCFPPDKLTEQEMQSLARDWQVPVSAFVHARADEQYDIRYFTTTTEIPACGHATLAAARAVFDNEVKHKVSFVTIENLILDAEQRSSIIVMTYPSYTLADYAVSPGILHSLQLTSCKSSGLCTELESLFIELDDPALLRNLQPDYRAMMDSDPSLKEIVITSKSDDPAYDFLLRSFCPWIGIDEDPVTGSVHSVLAGFWEKRLHKKELVAWQASPNGGKLFVRSFEDKVELGGESVVVSRSAR
jgi:predicted PhzF superfamily epimerase YddE/YHI9